MELDIIHLDKVFHGLSYNKLVIYHYMDYDQPCKNKKRAPNAIN